MRKLRFFLFTLTVFVFVCSVVFSAEEETISDSAKKELEKRIDGEIEMSPVSTKRHTYYKKHSQSEYLPFWKYLLFVENLPEAVTNWLAFANAPMEYLQDDGGVTKGELKDKLLENCKKDGHFTFPEFVEALTEAKINEKCFEPNSSASIESDIHSANEILNSLTFYQIADALVFLDQTNALPKVAERVWKTLDFSRMQYHETNDCERVVFGDGDRWEPSIYMPSPFKWDISKALRFCQNYKQEDVFLKNAKEALKVHPECLALLNQYCSVLVKQDRAEEALNFINENYPPEKIYHNSNAPEDYLEALNIIGRRVEWDVKKNNKILLLDREEFLKKYISVQLEDDCEKLLRQYWLWFGYFESKIRLAKEIVQPYLAKLPKHDMLTLRRLGQLSETNWFKAFVKEGWEKEHSLPYAVELAAFTEDSKEFAELISFIRKENGPIMGDIPFLTKRLTDESPASCADDFYAVIEKSGLMEYEFNYRHLKYFFKWCESKGRNDVVEKLKALAPKR